MVARTNNNVRSNPNGVRVAAAGRVNTIGLADRELAELLESLDRNDSQERAPVRRDFARWPFRLAEVVARIVHPGGTEVELRLACRNLSRGGACLLHNGYIHPGTVCRVRLPRKGGGFEDIPGVICRCSHRRGTLHELGVKFDRQVDLKMFMGDGAGAEMCSLERVNPETLKGKVLFVEECQMNTRIVTHFLRETSLNVMHVKTGAEAVAQFAAGVDILMVAAALPDMQGIELIAKARDTGVDAPALLIVADASALPSDAAAVLGSVGLLIKPLSQEALLRTLAERLLINAPAAKRGGAKEENPLKAIAPELLIELHRAMAGVRAAVDGKNAAGALSPCLLLRGAAPAAGLHEVSGLATKAVDAITGGRPAAEQLSALASLLKACAEKIPAQPKAEAKGTDAAQAKAA